MEIGAILIGIALTVIVGAYLARPFRAGNVDDQVIETWVSRARNESGDVPGSEESAAVNFCPQCGRRVAPDDRFCAGCGRQLRG